MIQSLTQRLSPFLHEHRYVIISLLIVYIVSAACCEAASVLVETFLNRKKYPTFLFIVGYFKKLAPLPVINTIVAALFIGGWLIGKIVRFLKLLFAFTIKKT